MVAKLNNIIVPFPGRFFQHVRYLTSSTPPKQTTNTMVLFDFVSLSLSLVYFTFALEGILPVFGFIMANELDKLWSFPDRCDATSHNSLSKIVMSSKYSLSFFKIVVTNTYWIQQLPKCVVVMRQ